MSGVGGPTVGTTSSSVRLHIYAVTYMTEISLHVTLNTNELSVNTGIIGIFLTKNSWEEVDLERPILKLIYFNVISTIFFFEQNRIRF